MVYKGTLEIVEGLGWLLKGPDLKNFKICVICGREILEESFYIAINSKREKIVYCKDCTMNSPILTIKRKALINPYKDMELFHVFNSMEDKK